MANKLAGQKMKFSKARATYYQTNDETERQKSVYRMAEVLAQAPKLNFSEEIVTQGADVPDEVRQYIPQVSAEPDTEISTEDDKSNDTRRQITDTVDTEDLVEIGEGKETVYAYGYRCAPDRLKIGKCSGDVVTRIANQIYTSTPDKPTLYVIFRVEDSSALERALHGVFRLQNRQVEGAGAEWFIVTPEEVRKTYYSIMGIGNNEI